MDLINNICLNLSVERNTILRNFLLPLVLSSGTFSEVSTELLTDLFNCLEKEEIEMMKPELEEYVGEFTVEEFLETEWKIGKCEKCSQIKSVLKCKNDHDEDCPYSEITSEEGCSKRFCESCVFHLCEEPCNAIRCESCSEINALESWNPETNEECKNRSELIPMREQLRTDNMEHEN